MKKFLIVIEGQEGCDYSINCGTMVYEIDAESKQAAFEQAMENMGWLDYYDNAGDYERDPWSYENNVEWVEIYEVSGEGDLEMFENFQQAVRERFQQLKDEEKELQDEIELKRLAEKLGKTVV